MSLILRRLPSLVGIPINLLALLAIVCDVQRTSNMESRCPSPTAVLHMRMFHLSCFLSHTVRVCAIISVSVCGYECVCVCVCVCVCSINHGVGVALLLELS